MEFRKEGHVSLFLTGHFYQNFKIVVKNYINSSQLYFFFNRNN